MPVRETIFANNEIYHLYNRSIGNVPIFLNSKYYLRFIDLIKYYHFSNSSKISFSQLHDVPVKIKENIYANLAKENKCLISIVAFCLMPNHYHLLVKQITDNGITKFISNVQNGYVKYFNIRGNRKGPLFQSAFKSVRIESDEQLLHVSRYIHLNPTTSYLVNKKNLKTYTWSSLPIYLNPLHNFSNLISTETILSFFNNKIAYIDFLNDQIDYQRQLADIKHVLFE